MDNSVIARILDLLEAKGKAHLVESAKFENLLVACKEINGSSAFLNPNDYEKDLSDNFYVYRCDEIRQIISAALNHYVNFKRYKQARKCLNRLEEMKDFNGDDLLAPDDSRFNNWNEFIDYLKSVKQSAV